MALIGRIKLSQRARWWMAYTLYLLVLAGLFVAMVVVFR